MVFYHYRAYICIKTHTHTESKSQQAAARRTQVRKDTRSDLGPQIKNARQVNRSDPIRVLPTVRPD